MQNFDSESGSKSRSRNYPFINLKKALDRAKMLKTKERTNYASVSVVCKHWGYSPKSSGASRTLSALIQYGLLDEKGKGDGKQVRVSKLANNILENPDENARLDSLEIAALSPVLFREMYERFSGDWPSKDQLKWELTGSGDPSQAILVDQAADKFIDTLFDTMALVGYYKDDSIEVHDEPTETLPTPTPISSQIVDEPLLFPDISQAGILTLPIPLGHGVRAEIRLPSPMTEQQWEKFLTVIGGIKALKTFLVDDDMIEQNES